MAEPNGQSDNHDDDHDHDHPDAAPDDPPSSYELLERALRELLIEKGVVSAEGLRKTIELLDSARPENGAKFVVKAWQDPAFKSALLANAPAAIAPLGAGSAAHLIVLENTQTLHNVVVCTLCSCYPRFLLGFPPAWYKSREYRARVVRDPRGALKEFGTILDDGVDILVADSTAETRYMVLPMRPPGTEGWPTQRLEALVTRDCLIGTAVVDVR